MCANLQASIRVTLPWNPDTRTIHIDAAHDTYTATLAVRAVLLELGYSQPPRGALCWCGQFLDVAAAVRRGPAWTSEVTRYGA
ncbi:hypothetical protein [Streptomyces sp. NPDC088733]|uniref:hypothetical protein n=1 Tax=Streptomyces sp. NPDC088733 TaxID=3365880 RepID=UPI00382E102A